MLCNAKKVGFRADRRGFLGLWDWKYFHSLSHSNPTKLYQDVEWLVMSRWHMSSWIKYNTQIGAWREKAKFHDAVWTHIRTWSIKQYWKWCYTDSKEVKLRPGFFPTCFWSMETDHRCMDPWKDLLQYRHSHRVQWRYWSKSFQGSMHRWAVSMFQKPLRKVL